MVDCFHQPGTLRKPSLFGSSIDKRVKAVGVLRYLVKPVEVESLSSDNRPLQVVVTAQNVIITLQRSNVRAAVCQQDTQHGDYYNDGHQQYQTP